MSSTQELQQQKIKELEARIASLQSDTGEARLVKLPNGDLYRPRPTPADQDPNIQIIPETSGDPLNRAVASILKEGSDRDVYTCTWCGIQFDGKFKEKDIRDHLTTNHPSVVKPMGDAAVLMAELAFAQASV